MPKFHLLSSICKLMIAMISFMTVHVTSIRTAEATSHVACTDCHLRGKALKAATVNALCLSCHPGNTKDHILGVIPTAPNLTLPLDKENKITCITCHEPHGKGTVAKLLRIDRERLCSACHTPK